MQEHLGFTSRTESFQRLQNSLTETFIQPGGVRIEHYAAPQGFGWGRQTNDKTVAARCHHRMREPDLQESFVARLQGFFAQESNLTAGFARTDEQLYLGVVPQFLCKLWQVAKVNVEQGSGFIAARFGDYTAADQLMFIDAGNVQRGAGTGRNALQLLVVVLQPAYSSAYAFRQAHNLIPELQAAVEQGSGHDCAESGQGKHPVNRQSRSTQIGFGRQVFKQVLQTPEKIGNTGACAGGDFEDRSVFEAGVL